MINGQTNYIGKERKREIKADQTSGQAEEKGGEKQMSIFDFLSRKNIPHIIYMNNTYDELQKNLKDATIRIHEMTG